MPKRHQPQNITIIRSTHPLLIPRPRPPPRMCPNQPINVNTHTPRINIWIRQTLGLHQRYASHDALIAILSAMVFKIMLETSSPEIALLRLVSPAHCLEERKVSLSTILDADRWAGRAPGSVAAGWVDGVVTDTHRFEERALGSSVEGFDCGLVCGFACWIDGRAKKTSWRDCRVLLNRPWILG